MLTRRDSIKLFAGLLTGSLFQMVPTVQAAPVLLWREEAARAAQPVVDAILSHPLTTGLIDGTLPTEAFLFYQADNVRYLQAYAKTLNRLAERLPDEVDREQMRRWAEDTAAAEGWARDTYREFSGREIDAMQPMSPAAELYAGWEARTVVFESLPVAVAAILPCFWVYGEIGRSIASRVRREQNPYAEWLSAYGDPAYADTVDRAMALGDTLARDLNEEARSAMTRAFTQSVRMEWMMWNAAYHREGWPI